MAAIHSDEFKRDILRRMQTVAARNIFVTPPQPNPTKPKEKSTWVS